MIYLERDDIILLHTELIEQFGGSYGIRDDGLLDSALSAPFQTFGGLDLYPSLVEKAAQLSYGLVHNHPFVDGNKRIGAHALMVFLEVNSLPLNVDEDEISKFFWEIASNTKTVEDLQDWILKHL